MTTLAEHIIVARAENYPPMIKKSMYDSLFIKGKKHGRMMFDSIDNGPLVYPTVYLDPLALVANFQTVYNPSQSSQHSVSPQPFIPPSRIQQSKAKFPQLGSDLTVLTFQQGEYPIDCINKAMTFLSDVASRPWNGRSSSCLANNPSEFSLPI
nr:hypothetical protein [Tanacetum cinerariifolium]